MSVSYLENAVLMSVEMHVWGIRRKLASSAVQTDADKTMIAVSKKLLESESYDAILKHFGKVRLFLETRSSGPSFLRAGCRFYSLAIVSEVVAYLKEARRLLKEELLPTFLADYAPAAARAEKLLGSTFDSREYPSADKVAEAFEIEWQPFEFTAATGKLSKVDPELAAQAKASLDKAIASAEGEIRDALRIELVELVGHLSDKLNGIETGSVKRLHETSVTHLTDFLATIKARDLTGDGELQAVCEQIGTLMQGVDAGGLKDSVAMRSMLDKGFEKVKSSLDGMVTTAPKRRLLLDKAPDGAKAA